MRILNQQYQDALRSEVYPFLGATDITSTDGTPTLPADCFLDLNLMVDESTTGVFLTSVIVGADVKFVFSTVDETVGTLSSTSLTGNQATVTNGTLVVGYAVMNPNSVGVVQSWVPGTYAFNAQVIPHLLVLSDKRWRRGFILPDGTVLEGDVYLVADRGLWLKNTGSGFTFNVTGDPFNNRVTPSRAIISISTALSDVNKNVNLVTESSVSEGTPFRLAVTPGTSTVRIDLVR